MIPFDLKSFKKGAIAVDKDWGEARFVGLKGDRLHCAFISGLEGVNVFDWVDLRYAQDHWHMKESKWIVFREFESEEEARKVYAYFNNHDVQDWKIKEV